MIEREELVNPNPNDGLQHIFADEKTGLTDQQAFQRREDGYSNVPVDPPSKTVRQIIFSNVFTYFNLIFIILAIALICVGSFKELTFLVTVFFNTTVCIIQELRAKQTLDKLNILTTQVATVVRSSREINIPVEDLVVDDIVVFNQGMQIMCDAIVVSGEITVNESLVTGESDEIIKKQYSELKSGSFVISGKCYARLTHVGYDSFVSKLTIEAKKAKKITTAGMMKSLTSLIKVIGILIIPVGIFLFINQFFQLNLDLKSSVENTTAALIGMIPEGLYLLTSLALTVSVIRLTKQKTLVHELGCIERLARVNMLCIDKTGTITENEMKVCDIVPIKADSVLIEKILFSFAGNMENENITMATLKKYANDVIAPQHQDYEIRKCESIVPFNSKLKYSAVNYEEKSYVIGAPEFILQTKEYKDLIDQYASEGKRVILLGVVNYKINNGDKLENVVPLGLITIKNPIRESAKATFEYFKEQGVGIKVISGDNPVTVSRAAEEAGIDNFDSYIDMSTIQTQEQLEDAAVTYSIFGRVTPEQKKQLIVALKKTGLTVAMTGDGVNDVLALKEADCSVAMASGSEVASQVSQVVLLNSDFASLPSVVAEGRRVINNIERSASLFLVKNIFSFIMAWVAILAVFAYPLDPNKLTLINVFCIGFPSFILALEPNTNLVKGKFLRNVLIKSIPAGLTDFILILMAVMFQKSLVYNNGTEIVNIISSNELSTIASLLMAVVGFMVLAMISKPFNKLRAVMYVSMITLFIVSLMIFSNSLLEMASLSMGAILIFVCLAALAYPVIFVLTKLVTFLTTKREKNK